LEFRIDNGIAAIGIAANAPSSDQTAAEKAPLFLHEHVN